MPEPDKKKVFRAEFIRLCARAGYGRQEDLAAALSVHVSTIRRIGSGVNSPTTDLYFDLVDILGADFERLMRTSPAVDKLRARRRSANTGALS